MKRVHGVQIKLLLVGVLVFFEPLFKAGSVAYQVNKKADTAAQTDKAVLIDMKSALKTTDSAITPHRLPQRVTFENEDQNDVQQTPATVSLPSSSFQTPPVEAALSGEMDEQSTHAPGPGSRVIIAPSEKKSKKTDTFFRRLFVSRSAPSKTSRAQQPPAIPNQPIPATATPTALRVVQLPGIETPPIPQITPPRVQAPPPGSPVLPSPASRVSFKSRNNYEPLSGWDSYYDSGFFQGKSFYTGQKPAHLELLNLISDQEQIVNSIVGKIKSLTDSNGSQLNSFKVMFNYSASIMDWFDRNINSKSANAEQLFINLRTVMSFIFHLQFFSVFCDRILKKSPHYFDGDNNLSFINQYDILLKDLFISYINKLGVDKFHANKRHNHNKTNFKTNFLGNFNSVDSAVLESAIKNNFVFLVSELIVDIDFSNYNSRFFTELAEVSVSSIYINISDKIKSQDKYIKSVISLCSAWIMKYNDFFDEKYPSFSDFKNEIKAFESLSRLFITFFHSDSRIYSKDNKPYLDYAFAKFDKIVASLCSRIKNEMLPLVNMFSHQAFPGNNLVNHVNKFIEANYNSKNAPRIGKYLTFKPDSDLWDQFNIYVKNKIQDDEEMLTIKSLKIAPYRESRGQLEAFKLRVLIEAFYPLGRINNAYIDVFLSPGNNTLDSIKKSLNDGLIKYFYEKDPE